VIYCLAQWFLSICHNASQWCNLVLLFETKFLKLFSKKHNIIDNITLIYCCQQINEILPAGLQNHRPEHSFNPQNQPLVQDWRRSSGFVSCWYYMDNLSLFFWHHNYRNIIWHIILLSKEALTLNKSNSQRQKLGSLLQ